MVLTIDLIQKYDYLDPKDPHNLAVVIPSILD
jgi:hypothetical protein